MRTPDIIAIDFDGTIVKHEYPELGEPVPGAIETMLELQKMNVKLILWTMRDGKELKDALDYCWGHGIQFFGANENPQQKTWTKSPKAYAKLYIDDAAFGCPLKQDIKDDRPWVDWLKVIQKILPPDRRRYVRAKMGVTV